MKTVAVIGLGPAGLATVKELRAIGFEVKGYDRSARVGGRWAQDPRFDTGVWKELCMNDTRRFLAYSDFEWNKEKLATRNGDIGEDYAGKYAHHTETTVYLEAYAEHFGLGPSFHLNTTVTAIERLEDNSWSVTSTTKDKANHQETFDALVVCSGLYSLPRNPIKDTVLKHYTGTVLHSAEFKSAKDFDGKRVLVVGSSISGAEIASVLAREGDCHKVVNSVRLVRYHVSKVSTAKGMPVDEIMFQRLPIWLNRYLPDSITSKGMKSTVLAAYPKQLTSEMTGGMQPPDPDIRKAGLTLAVDYVETVEAGKLVVKPGLSKAEGKKITFEDGSSEEFDAVVCATGYDCDLSFLPPHVQDKVCYEIPGYGAKEVALYNFTLVPDIENLAFAGILNLVGAAFVASEMQARYIAAVWGGKVPRASSEQMETGVAAYKAFREACPNNRATLSTQVTEDLGDELGLTPSTLDAIWNAKTQLVGALLPCFYRTNSTVEGPEAARQAKELLEYYLANPDPVSTSSSA